MAETLGKVVVEIEADATDATKAIAGVRAQAKKLDDTSISTFQKQIDDAIDGFFKMGKAAETAAVASQRARDAQGRFVAMAARATSVDAAGRTRDARGRFVGGGGRAGVGPDWATAVNSDPLTDVFNARKQRSFNDSKALKAQRSMTGFASAGSALAEGAMSTGLGALSLGATAVVATGIIGVSKALGGMIDLMKAAAAAAMDLATTLTTRLVEGLAHAADEAIKMETRFSNVRKTSGLTGVALGDLQQSLLKMATTMGGVKIDTVFETASMAGRLGVAGDQIKDFTEGVLKLSVAIPEIPAEMLATDITRILNVFGMGPEAIINFSSALNKLDDSTGATAAELLDLTNRLSAAASVFESFTPQKVMALATAMKEAGISAEVGGTAITDLIGKMATDTEAFAKIAGTSVAEFAATLQRDPIEALKQITDAVQKFDAASRFKVLEEMGLDATRTKTSLLQLSKTIDRVAGYTAAANKEWTSLDSITKEYEIVCEQTQAQIDRMNNVMTVLSAQVGKALLPVIKSVVGAFAELSTGVGAFLTAHQGEFEALGERIGKSLGRFGMAIKEWPLVSALAMSEINEKIEQLGVVASRVFLGLGDVLMDLFGKIGTNLSIMLSNSIRDGMYNSFLGGGVGKALKMMGLPDLAAPQDLVDVKPDMSPLAPKKLFGQLGVPNRDKEQAGLKAQIDAIRAQEKAAHEMEEAVKKLPRGIADALSDIAGGGILGAQGLNPLGGLAIAGVPLAARGAGNQVFRPAGDEAKKKEEPIRRDEMRRPQAQMFGSGVEFAKSLQMSIFGEKKQATEATQQKIASAIVDVKDISGKMLSAIMSGPGMGGIAVAVP